MPFSPRYFRHYHDAFDAHLFHALLFRREFHADLRDIVAAFMAVSRVAHTIIVIDMPFSPPC